MMETEPPRHAPPSRYKTVRRKPAVAANQPLPPPPSNLPPPPPPPPSPPPSSPPPPARQQKLLPPIVSQIAVSRPLIELASQPKQHDHNSSAQPEHHQLQRHQSKFRKILRLNISSKEQPPPPPSQPTSVPLDHAKTLVKLPERSQVQATRSDEDILRQKARDDAVAALEGKKRRSSKSKRTQDETAYDLKIELHHDKHGLITVPILNKTDAGALLEQVRPGHERCLVECWPSLGIQRQVRYFEPVTGVINTWDAGATSHLRMSKNVWGESSIRLEEFPKMEPTIGESMFYYYVTADKKWSKRSVSIGNSALKILKKDKPYDKDYLQTVNLDNFDIYTFTDTFSPKAKLRCPTKYCFTLKSQHKQSLFSKNSVFAHYFAIDDLVLFTRWYGVIRDIKGRMIAEKKGIAPWVETSVDESQAPVSEHLNPFADGSPTSPPRGRRLPKPLLSPQELAQPPPMLLDMQRSKSLHRGKSMKRTGESDRSASTAAPVGNYRGEVFSPGGLLGSDYEEKKRLALMQFKEERAKDSMFQSKSTAMRNDALRHVGQHHIPQQPQESLPLEPKTATPSISSHTSEPRALQRRGTTPSRPTTSGNKEQGTLLSFGADEINTRLPHHKQPRGRAHTVTDKSAQANGLISFATAGRSGEDGVPPIPSTPTMTRRPTTAKSKKLAYTPEDEQNPFTGTGLLARNFQSSGTATYGHGVKNGRDAILRNGEINPLMDMNERSVFAPGSLLERRERETGPTRPVIDRDPHTSESDE